MKMDSGNNMTVVTGNNNSKRGLWALSPDHRAVVNTFTRYIRDITPFSKELNDQFKLMCFNNIQSATTSPTHFSFWNIVAACLYCLTMKNNIPITINEIIEIDKKITRKRLFSIGKSIISIQPYTHEHRIQFILRLFNEQRNSLSTTLAEIKKELTFVDLKYSDISTSLRNILVYMRFFVPSCPNDAKEALTSAFTINLRAACVFFSVPNELWFEEMCITYKKNGKETKKCDDDDDEEEEDGDDDGYVHEDTSMCDSEDDSAEDSATYEENDDIYQGSIFINFLAPNQQKTRTSSHWKFSRKPSRRTSFYDIKRHLVFSDAK